MNKTAKIVLGLVFIGAAVGLYIYNNNKSNTTNPCPSGQVPCTNNGKCYDPSLHYNVDPCSAEIVSTPLKGDIQENITKSDINSTALVTK